MRRVFHLMKKELLELRRDPRLFGVVIIAPILQLSVLGYAATTDVKDIPIAIVDADRSSASRELVHRFETSANFKIVAMPGSTNEIDTYLDRGEAWMAVSIPPDYGRKVASGRQTTLQIVADGTDSNSTGVAMGYARANPERTTLFVVGDGAFLMTLGELETVARENIPLVIVVMNDRAYGAETHFLAMREMPVGMSLFPDVDFAPIAEAFGFQTATVRTMDELQALAPMLAKPDGPILIDCKINGAIAAPFHNDGASVSTAI